MARYWLKIPDYDVDVGELIEITVEAETDEQARQAAAKRMPTVAWDCADCVRMTEPRPKSVI